MIADNAVSKNALPEGWTWVNLGNLVDDSKQDLVDGPFGSNLKSCEYQSEGVPVLKIQNIKNNRFVDKNIDFINKEKADSLIRHSFKSEDLIITKLGNPLGACCRVPNKYTFGIIVADLMRLRPSKLKVVTDYLLHAINSEIIQKQFKAITKGTTRPRVNLTIVREIEIPLPPLHEQQRIVAKIEELFSELDKGAEVLKTAQQQLKVYRQAVLKWAFEGRLTNHNVLNGELPEGWKWVKIDFFLSEKKKGMVTGPFGMMLKKNEHQKMGVPVLGIENIGEGAFQMPNKIFITKNKAEELKHFRVAINDIIISRSGTVGNICAVPPQMNDAIISTNLIKVSINETIVNPKYFVYLFQGGRVREQVYDLCKGSSRAFLNQTILASLDFPYCSPKEQDAIISEIETRFSVADKLEEAILQSLRQAEALRQSILKKAFEGKLVPQDPNDEPASKLLERIKAEKAAQAPVKKARKKRANP